MQGELGFNVDAGCFRSMCAHVAEQSPKAAKSSVKIMQVVHENLVFVF